MGKHGNTTIYTIYIQTTLPFHRMKNLEKQIKRFLKETGLDFRTKFGNSRDNGNYDAFIRVEEKAPEGKQVSEWIISGESVVHEQVVPFFEDFKGLVNCDDNCVNFAMSQIIDHDSTKFFPRSQTMRYWRVGATGELKYEYLSINDETFE